MVPMANSSALYRLPIELRLEIMENVPSACDLLNLVQTSSHFRKLYESNWRTILSAIAEQTLPSRPDLVKDTLQAAFSSGSMQCEFSAVGFEWDISNNTKDIWNKSYEDRGAMMLLLQFVALANDVEALCDWIFEREDVEDRLGEPSRNEVKKALWMLQRHGQRVSNLDLLYPYADGAKLHASCPGPFVAAAKAKLAHADESMFATLYYTTFAGLENPEWSLAIDIVDVIYEYMEFLPQPSSLVSAITDGEKVALSRMHEWSIGLTDKEIVEYLRPGWRNDDRFDGTIQQEHPGAVKLEDTMQEEFGHPTGLIEEMGI
ncbi:hypothetical protein LTR37_015228 [Vermiconidia calcicola]|uniref:Uncharacterized protein n=1 Tax=Vermiconidia calcicola TaxID=1690605 RepID=A0ACC3MU86_9PEZI|nr:hypothetical protein LTR37_015228 [Vermiconidia calcicola]